MELFDILKTMFTDPVEYSKISNYEKQKYYFILQRRFSVQFPMQANALQHLKINASQVIDFWQRFLRKQYKFVPNWIYVKGIKKAKESKEKKTDISDDLIKEYCKFYKIEYKAVIDALKFYEDKMKKELKEFENILKQK